MLKLFLRFVVGYALCWFAVYLFIALPHATPMEVLMSWNKPEDPAGGLIVFGLSSAIYAILIVIFLFIKSYKQNG